MFEKGVKVTVATILGKRLSPPVLWRDVKDPWPKPRTITEMIALFPDFDSINFTHFALNTYEDFHKAIKDADRLKLMQVLSFPYYEQLKAEVLAKKCALVTYPKATAGKIVSGHIATSTETGLKYAYVLVQMTVKSETGEKFVHSAVMERRSDLQLPDYWKIGLITDNSNK